MSTTLDVSVSIAPIPTGAGGIVRGTTVTFKGTAKCIEETFDTRASRGFHDQGLA